MVTIKDSSIFSLYEAIITSCDVGLYLDIRNTKSPVTLICGLILTGPLPNDFEEYLTGIDIIIWPILRTDSVIVSAFLSNSFPSPYDALKYTGTVSSFVSVTLKITTVSPLGIFFRTHSVNSSCNFIILITI